MKSRARASVLRVMPARIASRVAGCAHVTPTADSQAHKASLEATAMQQHTGVDVMQGLHATIASPWGPLVGIPEGVGSASATAIAASI